MIVEIKSTITQACRHNDQVQFADFADDCVSLRKLAEHCGRIIGTFMHDITFFVFFHVIRTGYVFACLLDVCLQGLKSNTASL